MYKYDCYNCIARKVKMNLFCLLHLRIFSVVMSRFFIFLFLSNIVRYRPRRYDVKYSVVVFSIIIKHVDNELELMLRLQRELKVSV